MSDTPETDSHPLWHGEPAVHIDFARKLERERNAAEDERVNMAKQLRSEKEMHAHCQNRLDAAQRLLREMQSALKLAVDELLK